MRSIAALLFPALASALVAGEWSCSSGSNSPSDGASRSPNSGGVSGAGAGSSGGAHSGGADGSTPSDGSAGASGAGSAGATAGSSGGSADASSGSPSEGGTPTACVSNCSGKSCGGDGCGDTCGGCPPSQLCGPSQTCVASPSTTSIIVDAQSQGTPISSGIYGVTFASDDSMQIAALNRWGGDAVSSYNWKTDISNSGSDYNCANYKGRFTSPAPDSALQTSADQFVHYDITQHADTLMTIPITGWLGNVVTTADATYSAILGQPLSFCNYPQLTDGGLLSSETCCEAIGRQESTLVDQGSSVLDTSFMGAWVAHLVATFGTAASGGVKYYQLDNEPDNWQSLRTDVYPALYPPGTRCPPFYTTNSSIGTSLNQDFINRTLAYSHAIKAADPTASVLFMCMENPEDLVALPNVECGNPSGPYTVDSSLTMAILKLAAAEEASSHVRPLDCVDMHYPFPSPRQGLGDTSALWRMSTTAVAPRVQTWINSTYPGTGICVSEYNVPSDGADGSTPDPTTGAQEADLLGMYGRLGYKVASYFLTLVHGSTHLPIYNAMAMFRNYDGNGSRFGPYSIGAASPNSAINVYAASDSPTNPTKIWVMLVNVSKTAQSGLEITLRNFTPSGTASVYRMMGGAAPAADSAVTIANATISGLSVAVNSAALLVISR